MILNSNSDNNNAVSDFIMFDMKKQQNSREMRTAALKQTLRDVATSRRSHSSIDRAALPAPFPCPFIAPFQRSPPPLSLSPALSVFFSSPMAVHISLFIHFGLRGQRLLSLFLCLFSLSSYLFLLLTYSSLFTSSFLFFFLPSFSVCPLHLLRTQLFHLFLGRTDAAVWCNVTFIVPFSPFLLVSFLYFRSLLYFSLPLFLSFAQYPQFCNLSIKASRS